MSDDERDYIACSRLDGPVFTAGREDVCVECGAKVHVSRTSEKLIREHNLLIVCVPCAVPQIEANPDALRPPSPEQLVELAIYMDAQDRSN